MATELGKIQSNLCEDVVYLKRVIMVTVVVYVKGVKSVITWKSIVVAVYIKL